MNKDEFLVVVQTYAAKCRAYGTGEEVQVAWNEVKDSLDELLIASCWSEDE